MISNLLSGEKPDAMCHKCGCPLAVLCTLTPQFLRQTPYCFAKHLKQGAAWVVIATALRIAFTPAVTPAFTVCQYVQMMLFGCLTISLHNMGYAVVGPVVLLMPFLVLENSLDSSHNQHKRQCCCGPEP